ncbi:MAG: DUF1697 domain-containing protein [Deltaproteobacteria bacterium]|nr:DUF1697 domain-containing protein [Deltaproteobacteria bacterium]
MTRQVLLIRGVNVGTKNSLPMADLRAMLVELGCARVRTYLQSGNAVFDTKLRTAVLAPRVEALLERAMGRPIRTVLRTPAALRRVVEQNPFRDLETDPKHLCVTFFAGPPDPTELAPLTGRDWSPERFHVAGAELYTHHPGGQGRSPLAAALAKLGPRSGATTRNWNTVTNLLALAEED